MGKEDHRKKDHLPQTGNNLCFRSGKTLESKEIKCEPDFEGGWGEL